MDERKFHLRYALLRKTCFNEQDLKGKGQLKEAFDYSEGKGLVNRLEEEIKDYRKKLGDSGE